MFIEETALRGVDSFHGGTWAVSLVDYDQDGDLDIFFADDQCAVSETVIKVRQSF